ncbi:hypothetical protein ACFQZE_06550 [Paenibacillus sp. GCM10027627]|uniref:hypothetical protein n=1 Tax=unclassified Paenibacillus TaxID=185978 RepID=UPI0036266ADE
MMIQRNEKGKIEVDHSETMKCFDNLFAPCKNKNEAEWLHGHLIEILEKTKDVLIETMNEE